jgi:putative endonuclease
MKTYFVYILECSDRSYYTGLTSNTERIQEHNIGKYCNSYTYARRPVKLVYYEEFYDVWQAIDREKQIKRWSRAKKQALINKSLK